MQSGSHDRSVLYAKDERQQQSIRPIPPPSKELMTEVSDPMLPGKRLSSEVAATAMHLQARASQRLPPHAQHSNWRDEEEGEKMRCEIWRLNHRLFLRTCEGDGMKIAKRSSHRRQPLAHEPVSSNLAPRARKAFTWLELCERRQRGECQ